MKNDLWILGARRTAIGTFMGSLKNADLVGMGLEVAKSVLHDSQANKSDFVHSIFGSVCPSSSPDGMLLARHIALKAGLPESIGSYSVNRACGSGFEAIIQAERYTSEGPCLVGGLEAMSQVPMLARGSREGWKFMNPPQLIDALWESLVDRHVEMSMGQTAELLAKDFGISREDCDRWAVLSHQRALAAHREGKCKAEIVPLELKDRSFFEMDEHIRADSSLEKLAKLKPVFGGVTTAGNASGMNDAAACLIVSSPTYAKKWEVQTQKKALAKVVGSVVVGCDPRRMGIGPVQAIQKLMSELDWTWNQIDYLEVNEAFAAQVLAVKKALQLSDEQLNPHGSGISLGHPLGATGARISTHIAHEISSGRVKRAIGAACIGGGQGIAIAFESCH